MYSMHITIFLSFLQSSVAHTTPSKEKNKVKIIIFKKLVNNVIANYAL
jgi:hypothetical protein